MDELLKRRLAHNEELFREVNEQVQGLQERGGTGETAFVCECADQSCSATIVLSAPEYDRIRRNPTWFFVLPGHERSLIEEIVERFPGYLIVAKPAQVLES